MNHQIDEYRKDFKIIVEEYWVRIQVRPNSLITDDLILSILKELYSTEAYRSEKVAGLLDFRECKGNLNYEKFENIISYITLHYDSNWAHKFTAIVADKDSTYGLSRMYEIMTEKVPTITKIFKNIDDAQKWLIESSTRHHHS